jgi:hypothetical protein
MGLKKTMKLKRITLEFWVETDTNKYKFIECVHDLIDDASFAYIPGYEKHKPQLARCTGITYILNKRGIK